jgi:hypothetical protein
MPKYLIRGSYSDQGLKGLLEEGGSLAPGPTRKSGSHATSSRSFETLAETLALWQNRLPQSAQDIGETLARTPLYRDCACVLSLPGRNS